MKKQVLFLLLMLMPLVVSAENPDFVIINGIPYILNPEKKEAEVTYMYNNYYEGIIDIPESVEYNDVIYSVTSIGDNAFISSTKLQSVFIPHTVTSIGNGAFSGCSILSSVTLPYRLESIGKYAFSSCSSLTSVHFPYNMTYIGEGAFSECPVLNNITIPDGVTSIERSTFSYCYGLTSVTIPNGIISIGDDAFVDCWKLKTVVVPNSVKTIGNYVFFECNLLETITIGSGVTNIGEGAFSYCRNLSEVKCLAETVPSTASNAFENTNIENATLYVAHAIDDYRNTNPWSGFGNLVSIQEDDEKCETPVITLLANGKIKVESATEGAICKTTITASNAEPLTDGEISLSTPLTVYTITAYATKEGYNDSEVATATFRYEKAEGDINGDGNLNISDVVQLVNMILSK